MDNFQNFKLSVFYVLIIAQINFSFLSMKLFLGPFLIILSQDKRLSHYTQMCDVVLYDINT